MLLTIYLISLGVCFFSLFLNFYFKHKYEFLTVGIATGFLIASVIPIINVLIPVVLVWKWFWKLMDWSWDTIVYAKWTGRLIQWWGNFMDITLIKPRK
jgi:hypothetical protein